MGIVSLKIGKGETAVMTETRRLYYEDVYKKKFTATVLECREHKNVWPCDCELWYIAACGGS